MNHNTALQMSSILINILYCDCDRESIDEMMEESTR